MLWVYKLSRFYPDSSCFDVIFSQDPAVFLKYTNFCNTGPIIKNIDRLRQTCVTSKNLPLQTFLLSTWLSRWGMRAGPRRTLRTYRFEHLDWSFHSRATRKLRRKIIADDRASLQPWPWYIDPGKKNWIHRFCHRNVRIYGDSPGVLLHKMKRSGQFLHSNHFTWYIFFSVVFFPAALHLDFFLVHTTVSETKSDLNHSLEDSARENRSTTKPAGLPCLNLDDFWNLKSDALRFHSIRWSSIHSYQWILWHTQLYAPMLLSQ